MSIELGPNWQRELWASPYRLRFELGVGDSNVNMFTSAYDRARELARVALATDNPIGVVAGHHAPQKVASAKWRGWTRGSAFKILEIMGVPSKSALVCWKGYVYDFEEADDEVEPNEHRAVSLTWDQADILLWNQLALDRGVLPQAPVTTKLVNLTRGVSVYAYDDRGMDITALDRETLLDVYKQFDAWLLDADRPRIREAFDD